MISPAEPQPTEPRGTGGDLIRPTALDLLPTYGADFFRSHCRDVVEILQFKRPDGTPVISEHEATALIRGAVPLAAKAATDGRARDYRAVMGVLVALARLEQCERPQEVSHTHAHVHADLGSLVDRLEAQIARERAVDGHVAPSNGNGDA